MQMVFACRPYINLIKLYYHSCGYGNNYDKTGYILIDGMAEFILGINLLSIIKMNNTICKNTQRTLIFMHCMG